MSRNSTKTQPKEEVNGKAQDGGSQIMIEAIQPKIVQIEIEGISPLIVHAWSEKAKKMMLDKQMKKANKGREAKDPDADYTASRYVSTEGWDGIPCGGIKGCLVNACRATDGLPMTLAKRMVFIHSQGFTKEGVDLVRIYGDHEKHEAMVRLESGVADIRYRAIYRKWSAILEIEFLPNIIGPEQLANLVQLAGYAEGLCEARPGSPKNHTGSNGRFRIKESA